MQAMSSGHSLIFLPMNPLFDISPRMQPGFIVSNGDVVPLDAFRMSEFYNGWARPQGLCSPITLVTHRTHGRYLPLTLVKPDGAGDASEQDRDVLSRFAPHLIHAMNVTLRLQTAESRQEQLVGALECVSDGAILLDGLGRLVFVNEAAKALLDRPADAALRVAKGVLVACDPASDTALQAAISTVLGKESAPRATLVTIRRPGVAGDVTMNLAPLPYGSAWQAAAEVDGTGRPCCLILVNDGGIASLSRTYRLTTRRDQAGGGDRGRQGTDLGCPGPGCCAVHGAEPPGQRLSEDGNQSSGGTGRPHSRRAAHIVAHPPVDVTARSETDGGTYSGRVRGQAPHCLQ